MTDSSTPVPQRFTLDTSRAGDWLRSGPEPGTEPAWADEAWNPRSPGQEDTVSELVREAADARVIASPPGYQITFEYTDDPNSDYYCFMVRVRGERLLKVVSVTEEMRKIGGPGTVGIPAALSILEEAVRSGNGVLSDLDAVAAARAAGAHAGREEEQGIVLTGEQIADWSGLGRALTGDELDLLDACIPSSGIPGAIGTIVNEDLKLDGGNDEEDSPPARLYHLAFAADRETIQERGLEPQREPPDRPELFALARHPERPSGDVWEIDASPSDWSWAGTEHEKDFWVSSRAVPPSRLRLVHEAARRGPRLW